MMVPTCQLLTAILVTGSPAPRPEAVLGELARLEFSLAPGQPDAAPAGADLEAAAKPSFGSKNSWRWYLQGGFAMELGETENTFVLLGGGVSYFLVDNLSLDMELNALFIDQRGDDALGLNFNLLARWHFLTREKWSLYADGGAGILGTTEGVPGSEASEPRGGDDFNFTPQAGIGFTYELKHDTRLMAGLRWQHISNARTKESNPPRDSLLIYAGVSFPF